MWIGWWLGLAAALVLLGGYKILIDPVIPLAPGEGLAMDVLILLVTVSGAAIGRRWGPRTSTRDIAAVNVVLRMAGAASILGALCVSVSVSLAAYTTGAFPFEVALLSALLWGIFGIILLGLPSLVLTAALAAIWWRLMTRPGR